MKVSAVLKGKADTNGHLPVVIRVSDGQKRNFFKTGLKVQKTQLVKGRVKNHPKADDYNKYLERLIIQHQAANVDGLQKKKKEKVDFYKFLQQLIDEWDQGAKKPGTVRIFRSLFNLLKEFRPQLFLHEIDRNFLNAWRLHRLGQVEDVTVWSNFTRLRAVMNEARKRKLIDHYPFEDFDFPKYEQGIPVYLEKEELDRIEAVLPEMGKAAHYGWWFLVACHTGFRVGDLLQFNPDKHIRKDRILVHTEKEGTIVALPFSEKLQGYFQKLNYRPLGVVEKTYNEKIKVIAAAAGIRKEVSTHTARHTAAVNMATAGLSIEEVAKILGHKDLRSTKIYYQIINKKVDAAYSTFIDFMK